MKLRDKFPNIAFKNEHQGLRVSYSGLASLEGCPKIIHEHFSCAHNNLQSLVGGPERVEGRYFCDVNQLTSVDGIASYIGGDLIINRNPIESIAGIHKKITYLGGATIIVPNSCKGLLDVFKMNATNLKYFDCGNVNVNGIFEKYLQLVHSGQLTKAQAMLQCQSELIENNLDEYTEY